MRLKIDRRFKSSTKLSTINILKVLHFIHWSYSRLVYAIKQLKLSDDLLFKDVNFKLIIYVYRTYMVRLKNYFRIDLKELNIRTNNRSEGNNSGIAKSFSTESTIEEFARFVALRFKKDLIKEPVAQVVGPLRENSRPENENS